MGIWETLGIGITSDKRAIRKAYALRSKDCHPEEKPEEFKELYAAYQGALAYASAVERQNKKPEKPLELRADGAKVHADGSEVQTDGSGVQTDGLEVHTDGSEVHTSGAEVHTSGADYRETGKEDTAANTELKEIFQVIEAEREAKRTACLDLWEQLFTEQGNTDYLWEQFLESEVFRGVQEDTLILERICKDLEQDQESGGRIRDRNLLKLWERYDFHDGEQALYSGGRGRLYRCLYPAWRRTVSARLMIEAAQTAGQETERIKEGRRKQNIFAACFAAAVLCICAVIFIIVLPGVRVDDHHVSQDELAEERAERFLNSRYPGRQFVYAGSRERVGRDATVSIIQFYLEEEPEIQISVEVTGDGESGEAGILDLYGGQEIGALLEEAGLEYRYQNDIVVLLYRDFEDIKAFSARLIRFAEDERVKRYYFLFNNTAVCSEDVHAPHAMIYGGDGGLPSRKLYSLEHLPEQEELERELSERHIEYLYNYEAWNITEEMERRYGEEYRARIFPEEYLHEGTLALPTFLLEEAAGQPDSPGDQSSGNGNSVEYITIGNLYQYLRAGGVQMSVDPDGYGFSVAIGDNLYQYDLARADSYVTIEHAEEVLGKWMNRSQAE